MKTVRPLFFSLLVTMGFSFATWAGEPNPAAIGNEPSKMKKADQGSSTNAMPGRDCPPEMTHEKDAQPAGTRHRGPQHKGVLKE